MKTELDMKRIVKEYAEKGQIYKEMQQKSMTNR